MKMLLILFTVCLVTISSTRASLECKRCHEFQDVGFAQNISSLSDMESFLAVAGIYPSKREMDYLMNSERSGLDRPPFGRCEPELRAVPIFEDDKLASSMVVPSCVRIKRCGGCCYHPALTCTSTSSVTRHFMAIAMNQNHVQNSVLNVSVVEHLNCECRCKKNATHCNPNTTWNERSCSCDCNQTDDKAKCERNSEKYWNKNTCKCECKAAEVKKRICDGGLSFNENTCNCENRYGFEVYQHGDMPLEVDREMADLLNIPIEPRRCTKKCGEPQILNTAKCMCECPKPLKKCPAGYRINLNTCECRENAGYSVLASRMWSVKQDDNKN